MNRQIKLRGLALLLALLMAFTAFAGCQQAAEQSSAPAASDTSTAAAAATNITLMVVHKDGSEKEFPIATKEQYLRAALEAESLIAGEESEYGLFVKTVDGETADDAKQEWWCLTKDGEMTETGVDAIEIADGDKFEFTLTVGY